MSNSDDEYDTDDEKKRLKQSNAAKNRGSRKSPEQRRKILEGDPDIDRVEPYRVYCNRCHAWKSLDKTRAYHIIAWDRHKAKCRGITGKERGKRSRVQLNKSKASKPSYWLSSLAYHHSCHRYRCFLRTSLRGPRAPNQTVIMQARAPFRVQLSNRHLFKSRAIISMSVKK